MAVNEVGEAQMISMISHTVIHRYKFKSGVKHLRFSPDGRFFAACVNNAVIVFRTPGELSGTFNSFVIQRAFEIAYDETTFIDWSCNSKILAVGSKDNTVRVQGVEFLDNFRPFILGGHRDSIVGCFFEEKSLDVNTISKDGSLMIWECNTDLEDISSGYKKNANEDQVAKKSKQGEDDQEEDLAADKDFETSEKNTDNVVEHIQGKIINNNECMTFRG